MHASLVNPFRRCEPEGWRHRGQVQAGRSPRGQGQGTELVTSGKRSEMRRFRDPRGGADLGSQWCWTDVDQEQTDSVTCRPGPLGNSLPISSLWFRVFLLLPHNKEEGRLPWDPECVNYRDSGEYGFTKRLKGKVFWSLIEVCVSH